MQHLEKRPYIPAVCQQVGWSAGMGPDPHLGVRLVEINLVRRVARGLQAGNHALVAGLAPGIFLENGRGGGTRCDRVVAGSHMLRNDLNFR